MNQAHWQLIGHNWAVELLQGAIKHQRLGHAYLITGPNQIGKTTLARKFAQALNCQSDYLENRPCGVCRPCKLIAQDRHSDVRLVLPELTGRGQLTIKIDQIRELQKELNLGAREARYKVAILRQFDSANNNAANAFLKTLEEPPPNVMLILTASEADGMLPTINSRCRTLPLRPVPTALIQFALENQWQQHPDQAKQLAHFANGRLGWAIQALQDEKLLQVRQTQMALLDQALQEKRVGRFAIVDKLATKPETLPILLEQWLSWWRDLLLLLVGQEQEEQVINVDYLGRLQELAQQWTQSQILTALHQTKLAVWQLERNGNAKLVLENLMLKYPL